MLENENLYSTRLLHTMLRVKDLDKSVEFYTEGLGMTILRRLDFPGEKFTLVFVGYVGEAEGSVIELTYNWDTNSYKHGDAYGHIAIGTDDLLGLFLHIKKLKFKTIRKPAAMQFESKQRAPLEMIAFVEDPDGYMVELIQK